MTVSYKGKLSAALAIPVLAQAVASLDIPGLTGQVAALLKITTTFKPPSVGGTLIFAANLAAAASVAIVPPALSGSLRVYEYEGVAGSFGSELTTTLAGADADGGIAPTQSTFAVLLVAEGGTAGATTLRVLRSGV